MAEVIRESFSGVDPDSFAPSYQSDGGVHVEFYYNEVAQKDFCKMIFPGNKLTVWDQPVRESDKQRFYQQYRLYKEGKDQLGGKTMLQSWGAIDPGSIEEYGSMRIQTVEALASLSDQNITDLPAGMQHLAHRHREMAREYLDQKRQSAGFDKAIEAAQASQAVAEQAVQENAELKAQMQELQRRLDAQSPAENADFPRLHKRKPGGWEYELSDGQIVIGKDAAKQAQALLDAA